MTKRCYRMIQNSLLLISFFVVFSSFYFQFVQGLEPCPLCLMQRGCAFLLLIFCLSGVFLSSLKRARLISVLQMVVAVFGLFFALRQVWLQHLPASSALACLPGLDVLIRYFPWTDVVHALFWGAGECQDVAWEWLGLSMAVWSALYFLAMIWVALIVFWRLGRFRLGDE